MLIFALWLLFVAWCLWAVWPEPMRVSVLRADGSWFTARVKSMTHSTITLDRDYHA